MLVILNLANRKRIDQQNEESGAIAVNALDQRLSKHVELLNQQIQSLPTPETLAGLKKSLLTKNREGVETLTQQIKALQQESYQRLEVLEQHDLNVMDRTLSDLYESHSRLAGSFSVVHSQLQQLSSSARVESLESAVGQLKTDTAQLRSTVQNLSDHTKPTLTSLQDQINHLNRQFQKLPPPFDSSALKQEVEELIRVVAELVPRRDWSNVVTELKSLHRQQESQAQHEEILQRKIQDLTQQLQSRPSKANLASLQDQISQLHQQVQHLPAPFDSSSLQLEIAKLVKAVANRVPKRQWSGLVAQMKALQQRQELQEKVEATLRQELEAMQSQLQDLAVSHFELSAATQTMMESVPPVPPTQPQQEFQARIEETLRRELQAIDQQLRSLPEGDEFNTQVMATLRRELQDVNENLRSFPADPHYELVFDFKAEPLTNGGPPSHSSLNVLYEALETAQDRLILIWPWVAHCALDEALRQKMEALLSRGCSLDLGWCHPAEPEERFLSSINQRWINFPKSDLKETLHHLLRLKQSYPDQFQFKILGTPENFLVCDRSFAVVGTDEALLASTTFPELELKLRTTDGEVIQQLIQRFDNPTLDAADEVAYWNRAVTRYDLGDKEGAMADFSQVLTNNPQHSIAYNYRGLVRYDLGDREGAIADFNRSLGLNPHQIAAYCNRAFILSTQDDQLGAIADYSLAIQNHPTSAIAYFFRGLACHKYGDFLAAVIDFGEAIHYEPDCAPAYYYRGLVNQKMGEGQRAIADFEMAVNLFTQRGSTANAQKAMKNLIKLQQQMATLAGTATVSQTDPMPSPGIDPMTPVNSTAPSETDSLTSLFFGPDPTSTPESQDQGTSHSLFNLFVAEPQDNPSPSEPAPSGITPSETETLANFFNAVNSPLESNGHGNGHDPQAALIAPTPSNTHSLNPFNDAEGSPQEAFLTFPMVNGTPTEQTGTVTLTDFFYDGDPEVNRSPEPTIASPGEPSEPGVNGRIDSETLADFSSRF